ncbi:AKND1 protein, partial [Polypterus senegalus]|nr:AKND1 protein [Polypterus senegalus]
MSSIEDLDSSSYLNGSGSKITVDGDELKAHSDATDDESDIAEVPEALLWKKSFEHHILIDIGSDGGSQFVDRQDSFIFRFSQDSAEDDTLCITDDTDNFSFFDNGKDEEHHEKNCENPNKLDQVDQMKDSVLSLSEQKPNTQENMSQDCGNATDKQERSYEMLDMSIRHVASDNELLKLASLHMPLALSDVTCSPNPQSNSGENYRIHIMGDCERIVKTECEQIVKSVQNTSANEVKLKEVMDSPNKCDMDKLESPQTKISGMLLQHFTEDDQSIKFIEAETLTETSLTESMEETIHSQKSCTQKGEEFTKFEVEGPPKYNIANESFSEKTFLTEMELKQSEETCCMDNIDLEEEESELENTPPSPKVKDNDCLQNQKIKLVRASSFNRLKYGQGQVHYPLPDFSKVAPRIKIPKGSAMTETVKPSSSNFKRAVSSPGLLSKCSPSSQSMVDVVKKVLDTMQPNYALAFRDGQEADADLQQIPIQIPLGIMNAEITSDFHSMSSSKIIPNTDHHGSTPRLPELSLSVLTERKETHLGNMNIRDGSRMVPTEGEKMAESLKEMINLLTLKVEEFKHCLGNGALIIEEQQQVFKSLMAIQDKLERSYISQKEWHRTLELRKDMGKCKNIGDFDPEKQVEGEIFKLGMLLEDIREQIDENIRCQPFLQSSPSATILRSPSPTAVLSQTPLLEPQIPLLPETDKSLPGSEAVHHSPKPFQAATESFPLLPEEAHLSSTKFCSPGSPCLKIDLRNKPDSVSLNDAMQLADLSAGSTIDHWTNSVYSESSGANGHKGTDSDESSGSLSASPCGLHYRSPKSRQSHNLSERCCRFCSDKHSTAEEDLMSVASEEEDEHPSRRVIHEFPTCPHNVSSCSLPASSNYPSQMASAHVQRDSCLSDSALLSSRLYRRPTSITNPSLQNAYSRYRSADLDKTLNRAIEAAESMKKTTERMAKILSAELSRTETYRKMQGF